MSNFLKRTKRASEEIAYDEIHAKAKEQHYYPGIYYQRLFDAINEAGPTPTISQMTDIIHVVKTDFIDDNMPKVQKEKIYTTDEVWDLYRSDKDFFFTSFSDFAKKSGFVFIKVEVQTSSPLEDESVARGKI